MGVFWGNPPRKHVPSVSAPGRKIFCVGDKSVTKLSELAAIFVDIILSRLVSSCDRSMSPLLVCKKLCVP